MELLVGLLLVGLLYWACKPGSSKLTEWTIANSDLATAVKYPWCVFIDFDGVLHPGNSERFSRKGNLEEVLRKFPSVHVVISSSWRIGYEFSYVKSIFSSDISERIVGSTPVIPGASRETEIVTFCRKHSVERWVAIDDNASLFSSDCSWLFLTETHLGLDAVASKKLGEKMAATYIMGR